MGWGFLGAVAGAVVDVAGDAAGAVADAAGDAAEVVVDTAEDVAGSAADALDDYVLDNVDYLTHGVVDIDYDGGQLSANLGIRGVASAGVSIGERGFSAFQDSLVSSASVGVSGDGFELSGSAGIPLGPLPYAETHVEVSGDGSVEVGGRWQGTFPTPAGMVSTQGEYDFQRTPDGAWAAGLDAEATLYMPSGTYVGGGVSVHHVETADGDSMTAVGVTAVVGEKGVGEVGGGVGYQHIEQDGVEVDIVTGQAHASGYGFTAEGEAGYTRIEAEDGTTIEHFEASGSASGYGMSASAEAEYAAVTRDGETQSEWRTDSSFDGGALEDAIGDLGGGSITPTTAATASAVTGDPTAPAADPTTTGAPSPDLDLGTGADTTDVTDPTAPAAAAPEAEIADPAVPDDFESRIDAIDDFDDQFTDEMFDGQ